MPFLTDLFIVFADMSKHMLNGMGISMVTDLYCVYADMSKH